MKFRNTIVQILVFSLVVFFIVGFKKVSENEMNPYLSSPKDNKKTNYIAEMIANKKNVSRFENVSLFSINQGYYQPELNNYVKTASFIKLDFNLLSDVIKNNYQNIDFVVPLNGNRYLELDLTQVSIFTDGFLKKNNYKPGLYYRGIIKGNNNSIASISIFENLVMGIISNESGNYVLGPLKDKNNLKQSNYIFYNDADMLVKNKFHCMTDDSKNFKGLGHLGINIQRNNISTIKPIRVYYVADYAMYIYFNSDTNQVKNYISGVANEKFGLYQNEQIPVAISSIFVYTTPDPYINFNTSDTILTSFGFNTQDNFDGDLAQLLSTGHGGNLGGIAWINVLCASFDPSDNSGRFSFCNIDTTFQPIPTYSWTVEVVTHEMGHNLGSRHTQACVWPVFTNGLEAIDSCYTSEGGCFLQTQPNYEGTIMSYCHLNGAINFLNGFGPLPGDTIRLGYALASCIDTSLNISEIPHAFNLLQNYPNPFNPATNIKFALPQDGNVTLILYDITGREVVHLINNQYYNIGIFTFSVDANRYKLASGVYLYRINVLNNNKQVYTEVKKMVLIK